MTTKSTDLNYQRSGKVLKSVSILPDADAVLGHRLLEKGESFEMLEPKRK